MLSEFVLTVLFTVTLAFSSSPRQPPGNNASVQSGNSTDNVLPLNNDLAAFSVVNGDSDKLSRREFKRNRRVMKRNGPPKVRDRFPCILGPYSHSLTEEIYNTT